ncbi:MAG TPA: 50S ribosomal protein L1 [Candidatus Nanoarchaeia archaeon]|nr:50S ribosomal protein L1 [Candidatus Nanoarchaeia archaeon]
MDKPDIQKALTQLKEQPKRSFVQSYDLVLNLRNLDIKVNPIDFFVALPQSRGKSVKVCAFVAPELADQAAKYCDFAIREPEFSKYADKKLAKKLATEYDYFIAQANLMPKIAATFGKALGTKGKMPNPKLGCVVPPNANLEPLVKKLRNTVRLSAKKGYNLQCLVGKENQPDEEVIDNIIAIYETALKHVPNDKQNIKNISLKLTMSPPVKI